MKWTEAQKRAIELRGKDILVSAAAGSGKTAVLVQRIINLIIEDKVEVDKLLVVTFTKAAASEMKEKINKTIWEELSNSENSKDDLTHLQKQLDNIYRANISTFHSFAFEIVKQYFHVIDVDPAVKICDENQSKILKSQTMEECFAQFFEAEDQGFINYLDTYSNYKSDDAIKESLIELYDKLQSFPKPLEWFGEAAEKLKVEDEDFKNSELMQFINAIVINRLANAIEQFEIAKNILLENNLIGFSKFIEEDLEVVIRLYELIKENNWAGGVKYWEESPKFPVMKKPGKSKIADFGAGTAEEWEIEEATYKEVNEQGNSIQNEVKVFRDAGKKAFKDTCGTFFSIPLEERSEDIRETYGFALIIKRILSKFDELYKQAKSDEQIADFNDIEHWAIDILSKKDGENSKAAVEFQEKFEYVFVDEYQDSNFLQEEIINLIKRKNNLFMVGDVKQSIYGFRLAEPSIFMNKLYSFREGQAGGNLSEAIDLNMNFRSKGKIINNVNAIFKPLM
ncbi:MAG: UvrD-helicase domain-containing protein, partial [Anaerovoracaceae bacterium]